MTTSLAIGYTKNLDASDIDALTERDLAMPSPGAHDLIVDVKAVSVNPVDVKLRAGSPARGFRILGFDASGLVTEVGSEVTLFAPGDEVFYAGTIGRPGTNQQFHAVDERIVAHKPTTLSFADAAALPLTAITAWESLFNHLKLSGDSEGTLLVVGATGGVGSIMLQLAEALLPKVSVIATASSEERSTWVRDLGAEFVIDHHDNNMVDTLRTLAPGGVDWIFTAHSTGQIKTYAQIMRPFGHIVAIDDGPRDVSPLKSKSIAWHWELMFTRPEHQTADMIEQHRLLETVSDLVDRGLIRTTATTRLSPISADTLRHAHELAESGHIMGKVVLSDWR